MEIERTLFGDDGEEEEEEGSVEPQNRREEEEFLECVVEEGNMDWREGVNLIEDEGLDTDTILDLDVDLDAARRNAVYVEEGNFLDMFANGNRAQTPSPPRSVTPENTLTVLDLLDMVRQEISQLGDIMSEVS